MKNTFADNRFKKFRFQSINDIEKIKINFEIIVKNIFEKSFEIENEIFDIDNFANFKKN